MRTPRVEGHRPSSWWCAATPSRSWSRASLAELRQAVVVIADAVGGSLVHEHADTDALLEAVGALQLVAADGSLEELRNEVRRAADQLHNLAAERDARQRELSDRVTLLSDQVQILVEEVRQAQQVGTTDAMTGLLNRAGYEAADSTRACAEPARRRPAQSGTDRSGRSQVGQRPARPRGWRRGDPGARRLVCAPPAGRPTTSPASAATSLRSILMDADAQAAERIVGRFLQELWSRNIPASLTGAEPIRVSASVGIAQAVSNDDAASWTERADRWMYQAKGMGKNRVLGDGLQAGVGPDALPDKH